MRYESLSPHCDCESPPGLRESGASLNPDVIAGDNSLNKALMLDVTGGYSLARGATNLPGHGRPMPSTRWSSCSTSGAIDAGTSNGSLVTSSSHQEDDIGDGLAPYTR